jgi:sugar lactone lactonase YvrE
LAGTPTTAGTFNVTIQTFQFTNGTGIGSPVYPYTIIVNGSSTASAPAFTTQPASQTVAAGNSVTFTAAASGSPNPTYQWMKDNAMIAGATSASFLIASVAAGDAGTYTVVATHTAGSATSNGAVLTVNPPAGPSAPTITAQPQAQTMTAGHGATFTVAATGNPAPTDQWQRLPAGSAIWETLNEGGSYHGVASATLSVDAVTAAMSGDQFRVLLTNASGAVTSSTATLTVSGTASALLQYPTDVAPDGSGNLYATDASSDTIRKIAPDGTITTFAGSAGIVGSADGTGTAAQFNQPGGVVVDGSGNVYVADTGNATIRKITPAGVVTTLAGSPATRGSTDGTGSGATFNQPGGLALDSTGTFYVADAFNDTIRKITPAGVVTTLAGTPGSRGDADGTGAAALFNFPDSVAVDATGNVYVADTFNDSVRKITPAGVVTTLAGSAGISGSNDGTGANALFNQPYGVAVDATGNVYVADTANATIRKITPAGAVTTLAGVAGVAGMGNGAGTSALFNQPRGLVVDSAGNVFVADTGNGAIRKVAPDGTVSTVALTTPPPPPPPPPPPGSTPPPQSMGGGGGGGAVGTWFLLALSLLATARGVERLRAARCSLRR